VAAVELNSCATGVELLGAGTSVFLCKPVMVCHKIAREESPAESSTGDRHKTRSHDHSFGVRLSYN